MLFRTVGIQEFAGQIDYAVSVPVHDKAGRIRHVSDYGRLQVFGFRQRKEPCDIPRVHYDRHALLRLADSQLGAVQPVILAGNRIQINLQSVSQLPDGDRNTAGAEIVAALDQCGNFISPEQSLQISLHRRITFLNFRTAGVDGLGVMSL